VFSVVGMLDALGLSALLGLLAFSARLACGLSALLSLSAPKSLVFSVKTYCISIDYSFTLLCKFWYYSNAVNILIEFNLLYELILHLASTQS